MSGVISEMKNIKNKIFLFTGRVNKCNKTKNNKNIYFSCNDG